MRVKQIVRVLMGALVILGIVVSARGDMQTHQQPNEVRQRQIWAGDALGPYVHSGCEPAVPGASLTLAAFACEAYVRDQTTDELIYSAQSAASMTLANVNGAHWLAVCRDTSSAVAEWTRQAGTKYVHRQTASLPEIPTGCLIMAEATVAGSVITAVVPRFPSNGQPGLQVNVLDPVFKVTGDCVTNDGPALQHAIDTAGDGGTVVWPALAPTQCYATAQTLDIRSHQTWRGSGGPRADMQSFGSQIRCTGILPTCVQGINAPETRTPRVWLEGLTFRCDSCTTAVVNLQGALEWYVTRVSALGTTIAGAVAGFDLVAGTTAGNHAFYNLLTAITVCFNNTGPGNGCTSTQPHTGIGVRVTGDATSGNNSNSVDGGNIRAGTGMLVMGFDATTTHHVDNLHVSHVQFENAASWALDLQNASNNTFLSNRYESTVATGGAIRFGTFANRNSIIGGQFCCTGNKAVEDNNSQHTIYPNMFLAALSLPRYGLNTDNIPTIQSRFVEVPSTGSIIVGQDGMFSSNGGVGSRNVAGAYVRWMYRNSADDQFHVDANTFFDRNLAKQNITSLSTYEFRSVQTNINVAVSPSAIGLLPVHSHAYSVNIRNTTNITCGSCATYQVRDGLGNVYSVNPGMDINLTIGTTNLGMLRGGGVHIDAGAARDVVLVPNAGTFLTGTVSVTAFYAVSTPPTQ